MSKADEIFTGLMEQYFRRAEETKLSVQSESSSATKIFSSSSAEVASSGTASEQESYVDGRCRNVGCKRKDKADCVHHMCFQCCDVQGIACEGHRASKLRKLEEDKYIEEGIKSLSKQKTSFYHFEDRFMKSGQTVVVWCLRDFLRNKHWSGDVLAQQRAQRSRSQRTSRFSGAGAMQSTEDSSSRCWSGTNTSSSSNINCNIQKGRTIKNNRQRKAVAKRSTTVDRCYTAEYKKKMLSKKVAARFEKVKQLWNLKTGLSYCTAAD